MVRSIRSIAARLGEPRGDGNRWEKIPTRSHNRRVLLELDPVESNRSFVTPAQAAVQFFFEKCWIPTPRTACTRSA
jgi:hypothetical protein